MKGMMQKERRGREEDGREEKIKEMEELRHLTG